MEIYDVKVTMMELKHHINLTFFVHGCQNNCKNCHWKKEEWKHYKLPMDLYEELLYKYASKATAVVFLGGEWNKDLQDYLKVAKEYGFKTCLYTGLTYKELERLENGNLIIKELDYLKVGRYIDELGGLYEENTNQQLIRMSDMKVLYGNKKEII